MTQTPSGQLGRQISLRARVHAQLRREISFHSKPGDLLESQNELAERLGVSVVTVREALSVLEEEGVIRRRRGSGTYVLEPSLNQHVAVVTELGLGHPRLSYFFRRTPSEICRWLAARGVWARMYFGSVSPDAGGGVLDTVTTTCPGLMDDIDAGRVRAVAAAFGMSPMLHQHLAKLGIPVVAPGAPVEQRVNYPGAKDLVRIGIKYLLSQGRRNLAFMAWGQASEVFEAVREGGIDLKPRWLRTDLQPASAGAGWKEFREIWSSNPQKPDGLVIADDILFIDAAEAIRAMKVRVPEELMVVTLAHKGAVFPSPFPVAKVELDPDVVAGAYGQMVLNLLEHRPAGFGAPPMEYELVPMSFDPPGYLTQGPGVELSPSVSDAAAEGKNQEIDGRKPDRGQRTRRRS